jgi:hypothetical protein
LEKLLNAQPEERPEQQEELPERSERSELLAEQQEGQDELGLFSCYRR